MTGLLTVEGKVDVSQFWPTGESDADTVKLILKPQNAFAFRASPGHAPLVTQVFEKAGIFEKVKGQDKFKPLIKNGAITLRLQGIDAPELHYLPRVKNAKDFRQFLGETCAVALGKRLKQSGNVIPCQFITAVDHPKDVVDKFGRFVGEILFNAGSPQQWNICDWLLQQGWAFPAYYNSMSVAEIKRLQAASSPAEQAQKGVWAHYTKAIGQLDWNLVYRKHGTIQPAQDKGPVIFPKIFRRLGDYSVKKKNGSVSGTLKAYLSAQTKPDTCYSTSDFLAASGNPPKSLRMPLAQAITTTNQYSPKPGGLVFVEAGSSIVDKNKKPIGG